jgi:hypothetical protein
MLVVRRH